METKVQRESNFEVLRIISIVLILIVHAAYKPFQDFGSYSVWRAFACTLGMTGVNIFVLITGWFGTKLRISKLFSLIYQVVFISAISVSIILFGNFGFDKHIRFNTILYWFIVCYIGLIIFTPILNAAVKALTRKGLLSTIIIIYVVVTAFDPFSPGLTFRHGNSTLWFMELYLLGRYLRLYPIEISKKTLLLTAFLSLVLNSLIMTRYRILSEINPALILTAVSFLLLTAKSRQFYCSSINSIASSVTMVYLLNDCQVGVTVYKSTIRNFYETHDILSFIGLTILLILLYFIIGIAIDQIRKFTFAFILKFSSRYIKYIDNMLKGYGL